MDAIVAERTTRQWLELLERAGVPAGSVNSVAEICEHPQIKAREMVVEVPHPTLGSIKVSGVPIKLSDTPGAVSTAPPLLGQHTAEILTGLLGYSLKEVEGLRKAGVV